MSTPPYDCRAVANLMLDEAVRLGIPVSNLALQKLLYFAHGLFLIENKVPLVDGHFEAWQYGPVHPVLYRAFKDAGAKPISHRVLKKDILTGVLSAIQPPEDQRVIHIVQRVMLSYGKMTAGRLIETAHATDAPWHYVVDKAKTGVSLGTRISDTVIIERFRFHKVSVGETSLEGETLEDTPIAWN